MRAVKRQTTQQSSATAQVLVEANMSRDSVQKGQGGVTHLGLEMIYQVQQLLHAPLKGRRIVAGVDAQRQSVCVQPGAVANYPGICRYQLDSLRPFVRLCVRLSPAVK